MKKIITVTLSMLLCVCMIVIFAPSISAYADTEPVTHTITYNLNEGTIVGEYATTYVEGEGLILPNFNMVKKTGYAFGGWYLDENCIETKISTIPQNSTTDYVLYAKWLKTSLDDKREEPRVIISSDRGFEDNDFIVVEYVTNDLLYSEAICNIADENATPLALYTIKYYNNQNNVISSNSVNMKLLMPRELKTNEEIRVYYVDLSGEVKNMPATIEGGYVMIGNAVISGTYVVATYDKSSAGVPWWVYTALIVTIVSFAILILLLTKKKKEYKININPDAEVEQYTTEKMPTIGEDAELSINGEEYKFVETQNVGSDTSEASTTNVEEKKVATKKPSTTKSSGAKGTTAKVTTKKTATTKTTTKKPTTKQSTTQKTDTKKITAKKPITKKPTTKKSTTKKSTSTKTNNIEK